MPATPKARAPTHAYFAKRIADAEGAGEAGEGFAKRIASELRAYKAVLPGEGFDALRLSIGDRALRAEANARARDRILRVGQTIDMFVAAAKAAPENFATHFESAEEALGRLQLPAKAMMLFRQRLADIPAAALGALVERAPSVAVDLIKRREGPAAARFGVSRTARRLIAKQAEATQQNADLQTSQTNALAAARAHTDANAAITAAERGEAPETALTAWLPQASTIGDRGARELRKRSAAAAKAIARRKDATARARERLARGEPLDDAEGADGAYTELPDARDDDAVAFVKTGRLVPRALARATAARLRSDDLDAAAAAARMVAAFVRDDESLVAAIDPDTVREALTIDAALSAGLPAAEAVRRVRDAADVPPRERSRRAGDFERAANGGDIARLLERLFGASVGGIED